MPDTVATQAPTPPAPPTPTAVRAVLQDARTVLADPSHWTQNSFACDAHGNAVPPASPRAVAWCARGALYRTLEDFPYSREVFAADVVLNQVAQALGFNGVAYLNDQGIHALVLQLYDQALTHLEESHP